MSDNAYAASGVSDRGATVRATQLRNFLIAFPIASIVVLLGFILWEEWHSLVTLQAKGIPAWGMLSLSLLLALLPVCICVVQNVTRNRQLRKLNGIANYPVARTAYYIAAKESVQDGKAVAVGSDYLAPISVYSALLMIGFSIISLGVAIPGLMKIPSVVLGGWSLTSHTAALTDVPGLAAYQTRSFVIVSTAFIGAYVYSLNRLLDRVNNNDLYPISLYYYAVRAIIAVFVAAVIHHSWEMFGLPDTSALILVGFVVGMAPDSFIAAMTRRAFQLMKITAVRGESPKDANLTSLSLMMIDDLSRDKIDRLNELGIDNAHVLSRQNPFLLWPRLPYDLTLIVDWIGQAHLYTLLSDEKLLAVRAKLVRDSFDLQVRMKDDKAKGAICGALDLSEDDVPSFLQQLESDPAFIRLCQVRQALAQ